MMNTTTQHSRKVTGERTAARVWKDTPASTAEQIEIAMRRGNSEKQAILQAIVTNCNFILANSDNAQMKQFALVIRRIATQPGSDLEVRAI
jgi:hypothetical protein